MMEAISLYAWGHLALALGELGLLVLIFGPPNLSRGLKNVSMLVLALLVLSTFYNNSLLGLGNAIGEGPLLEFLSKIRFLLHLLVIPLFVPVGVEIANRAGAGWAIPLTRLLAWAIGLGAVAGEYFSQYLNLSLVPVQVAGILRYTAADAGPPIATIFATLFLAAIGIGLWVRSKGKWPWLFLGTLVGLVGNAIPIAAVGTLPGNAGEFAMELALLATEWYTWRRLPDLGIDRGEPFQLEPLAFNWVAIHPQPQGVIYFIGGAAFGTFPTIFYRYLLRRLFQARYTIVAIPFRFTLDHWSVAIQMVRDRETLMAAVRQEALARGYEIGYEGNADVYSNQDRGDCYWLGHSLGCKYIALLESLSDSEEASVRATIDACIPSDRDRDALKALPKDELERISLRNQPSILMAPIITGIEGAIPVWLGFIAELIKNFIDVRPTTDQTKCLIRQGNLFHFVDLVVFAQDGVEKRAQTAAWLGQELRDRTNLQTFQLGGRHLAPLNLLNRNQELADLLLSRLPVLKARVQGN